MHYNLFRSDVQFNSWLCDICAYSIEARSKFLGLKYQLNIFCIQCWASSDKKYRAEPPIVYSYICTPVIRKSNMGQAWFSFR